MIITVPVEIDKTKVEDFQDLVEAAFQTAMQFGRELVRQTLEAMDGTPGRSRQNAVSLQREEKYERQDEIG